MTLRLGVIRNDGFEGREWRYEYELDLPEKTGMETIEAHAKTMLAILDGQAQSGADEDDDDTAYPKS